MTSNDEFELNNEHESDKAFAEWTVKNAETLDLIEKANADAAVVCKKVRITVDPHRREELYKEWKRLDTVRSEAREKLEESEKK